MKVKVWAISDLHVRFSENRTLLESVSAHPDDWLILGGDLGEGADDLHFVFRTLAPKFARLFWVPGNHELWTIPGEAPELRGEAKYQHLVSLCHEYGVLTPEDPYPEWPNENRRVGAPAGPDNHASYTLSDAISDERARSASSPRRLVLAPLFLLYDYSFRPDDVTQARAVEWAADTGLACTDEALLNPDPHPNIPAWCAARCKYSEQRLRDSAKDADTILVNHFPLKYKHTWLLRMPRFSIWCGTRRTEDWAERFRARVAVYGHLHIRRTHVEDGVRFEEVSLGYPRQWLRDQPADAYLRQIWPPPAPHTDYHG